MIARPRPFSLLWKLGSLPAIASLLLVPLESRAGNDTEIAAVYSKVASDYTRTHLPDGTLKPETYALGEGGLLLDPSPDASISKVKFVDIAHMLGKALARQRYVSSTRSENTDLLIMVYWGTTAGTAGGTTSSAAFQGAQMVNNLTSGPPPPTPPPPPPPPGPHGGSSATPVDNSASLALNAANQSMFYDQIAAMQLQNGMRDRADDANARILGYSGELARMEDHANTPLRHLRQDIIDEVEENRYFVIMVAYDFQRMKKDHQPWPRWVTRFSIRERGNDFGEQLPLMIQYASSYFGSDTRGLVRKPLREGKIEYGELRVIEAYGDAPKK